MTAPSSHLKNITEISLSLHTMTDNMLLKHGVLYVNCSPLHLTNRPLLFSNRTFPFHHIPSYNSHRYSILFLTLLYILRFITQVGCFLTEVLIVLFLFVYLGFGFLVLFFVRLFLWFGFLVAAGVVLFCRNSTSFLSIPTYHFWWTKKFESYISADWIPRVQNQPSSKWGRVSFWLGLYFLCHTHILADLSNPSTQRDRLRPSTLSATVLII